MEAFDLGLSLKPMVLMMILWFLNYSYLFHCQKYTFYFKLLLSKNSPFWLAYFSFQSHVPIFVTIFLYKHLVFCAFLAVMGKKLLFQFLFSVPRNALPTICPKNDVWVFQLSEMAGNGNWGLRQFRKVACAICTDFWPFSHRGAQRKPHV
jgi:hypothetical protein